MFGLFLQGENLYSDLVWLDLATAAVQRRFLSEGVAVEESRRMCVCHEMIGADMVNVVVCRSRI